MRSEDSVSSECRSVGALRLERALVVIACLVPGIASGLARASEESVLDSTRIAALRAALAGTGRARVVAGGRQFLLDRPAVTPTGLGFRSMIVREGFAFSTVETSRPIPWSEIASVEALRSTAGRGAGIGLFLGAIAGNVIGSQQPCQTGFAPFVEGNCGSRRLMPMLVGALGGAAIGALLARRYDRWHPLYP